MKNFLTPLSILVAGAFIAGAVVITQGDGEGDRTGSGAAGGGSQAEDIQASLTIHEWSVSESNAAGDPDAPVTIVEYSDFACPFCGRYWQTTLPGIKERYIDEGLVHYIYKDFAVVGGERAAEAAWCAEEQGAFWAYHDTLFSRQDQDRQRWGQVETHRVYAEALDLDADALVDCFEDRRHRERVVESTREAQELGGRGTPYFLINDVAVSGAQPIDVFIEVIEGELEN